MSKVNLTKYNDYIENEYIALAKKMLPMSDLSNADITLDTPNNSFSECLSLVESYHYNLKIVIKDELHVEVNIPKIARNMFYFSHNNITPTLTSIVTDLTVKSPFLIKKGKSKDEILFVSPEGNFSFNSALNEITLDKEFELSEKSWKKLNLYNKNITNERKYITKKTISEYIIPIASRLIKNEITYYDLEFITTLQKFLSHILIPSMSGNNISGAIIQSKIRSFVQSGQVGTTNSEKISSQAVSKTNPLSIINQSRKIYLRYQNYARSNKVQVSFSKFLREIMCPVKTHEGNETGIRNEIAQSFDLDALTLKLRSSTTGEVVYLEYYEYFNSRVKVSPTEILYRGDLVSGEEYSYSYVVEDSFLSYGPALIPFLNHTDSVRGLMGSSMMDQSIPVIGSKPNIVFTGKESEIFTISNLHIFSTEDEEIILEITSKYIKTNKKLYHSPNSITSFSNTYNTYYVNNELALGMSITLGTILFCLDSFKENEFTTFAQLLIGYINYQGFTFEDGIVISETASKKLSHQCSECISIEINDIESLKYVVSEGDLVSKGDSLFTYTIPSSDYRTRNLRNILKIDDIDQVSSRVPNYISKGTISSVKMYYLPNKKNKNNLGVFDKLPIVPDSSIRSNYRVVLTVDYINEAKIGDKLSNRYGSKGVITKILPDNQMPRDQFNNSLEIMMSPDSILSRKNISQAYEVVLGKILVRMYHLVAQNGVDPYCEFFEIFFGLTSHSQMSTFHAQHEKFGYYRIRVSSINFVNFMEKILRFEKLSYGFSILSSIQDPITGRILKNEVLAGYSSFMRLHFIVEKRAKATSKGGSSIRTTSNGAYTSTKDSLTLGSGGVHAQGQKLGEMELWAFGSHNALPVLKHLIGKEGETNKQLDLKLGMNLSGLLEYKKKFDN